MRSTTAVGVAAIATIVVTGAPAGAGEPVLTEDFDDNVIDERWSVVETDPDVLNVFERNQRLEFPAQENPGVDAVAGIAGSGWALDVNDDLAMHVDVHASLPDTARHQTAAVLILVFDGEIESVTIDDALVLELGRDEDGPFLAYAVVREGVVQESGSTVATDPDVTFFVWYEAATDTLAFSVERLFDPEATRVFGLRTQSGSDRVTLYLGAYSDGSSPPIPGEALFFDTLVIESATIIATCPEDLDDSGVVDFGDVLPILAAWGNAGGPEDLDDSGVVDFGDVLLVLGAWGPCP